MEERVLDLIADTRTYRRWPLGPGYALVRLSRIQQEFRSKGGRAALSQCWNLPLSAVSSFLGGRS
jgi:hypothetical protein